MKPTTLVRAAFAMGLLMGGLAWGQKPDSDTKTQDQHDLTQKHEETRHTETIRGELAAVSVVGETMVDYHTGQGVVAELTYLTILGSPVGDLHHKGQADSQHANRAPSNVGDDKKGDHSDKHRSGDMSRHHRRHVYQIAIGPETKVCDESSGQKKNAENQAGEEKQSARAQSLAALERLEIGDRVEVKFTHQGHKKHGTDESGKPQASGNMMRHGRHRIIRGVAETVTILATPEQIEDRKESERKDGKDSSSPGQHSDSNAQQKSSGEGSDKK